MSKRKKIGVVDFNEENLENLCNFHNIFTKKELDNNDFSCLGFLFIKLKEKGISNYSYIFWHPGNRNTKTEYTELIDTNPFNLTTKIIFISEGATEWNTPKKVREWLSCNCKAITEDMLEGFFYLQMLELCADSKDNGIHLLNNKLKLKTNGQEITLNENMGLKWEENNNKITIKLIMNTIMNTKQKNYDIKLDRTILNKVAKALTAITIDNSKIIKELIKKLYIDLLIEKEHKANCFKKFVIEYLKEHTDYKKNFNEIFSKNPLLT